MNNNLNVNLEKYDYMTSYEQLVGDHLEFLDYDISKINPETKEEDIFYLLTIQTILYKEYEYNKYFEKIIKNTIKHNFRNDQLLEIIQKLNEYITQKRIKAAHNYIIENQYIIEKYLKRYYSRKQLNYIQAKKPMEIINSSKKIILALNPYTINQCILQSSKKLTEEEKIIGDIIDFATIIEITTQLNKLEQILSLTKQMMIKNYSIENLKASILFIMCDVYQETMQNKNDVNYELIKEIIEQTDKYTNEKILETFILSEGFSTAMLSSFIYYNKYIKEGRLESLKQLSTYEFVKKRINQ